MEDQLIRVDLYDREIGYASKEEIHKNGWLHRAFSVFLVDGDRMLIQKRNLKKYHSGGLWANACCSHPRQDEGLEEAVERRLFEELGVSAPCRELSHFVYYARFENGMSEYELDHIFVGHYDGEVSFDKNEIAEVKWVDFDWLEEDLQKNPDSYAVWFLTAAPRVLEFLRN